GTDGGGLQRFRPRVFRSWGLGNGLPERVVPTVTLDRLGRVLVGTLGQGVLRKDDDRFTPVPRTGSDGRALSQVFSVLVDRKARLWVGGLESGLDLVEGNRRHHFPLREAAVRTVFALFEDSRGRVWVGSDGAVFCYDGGRLKTYPVGGPSPSINVNSFAEDA